jgi:hypothetical protein
MRDPDSYSDSHIPLVCVCWSVVSIWLASTPGVRIRSADLGLPRVASEVRPWIVAAFCYLRTQAGLLALRDRPIMLGKTEAVTRQST